MANAMYALVSVQGTAEAGGVCGFCLGRTVMSEEVIDRASAFASMWLPDDALDIERGLVDVTGNEAVECIGCGIAGDKVRYE